MYKMDAAAWILLILVLLCVFALILIAKRKKELDEVVSGEPVKHDHGSAFREPHAAEPETNQVTIYHHHYVQRMQLCPVCDGENDLSATYCHICGQPLK